MLKPHLEKARQYWTEHLKSNDIVIDATCGNGKDTAFLAELVPQGKVVSLDIQEIALTKARQFAPHSNVTFLHQSHANLPSIEGLKLVVYNLGYLPGGDKTITTMTESTLISLAKAAELVVEGGALSITCYPGHLEGAVEEKAVAAWVGMPNVIQNLTFGKASASDLQQVQPAPKQPMCKHLDDAGGCKDGDAGAAKSQILNHVRYKLNFEKWHVVYHQWRAGSPTLFFIVKLKI